VAVAINENINVINGSAASTIQQWLMVISENVGSRGGYLGNQRYLQR